MSDSPPAFTDDPPGFNDLPPPDTVPPSVSTVPADLKKERRKKAGFTLSAPALLDRLPPHSPEAEQGVLGCILLSPEECLPQAQNRIRQPEAFYDLRHQKIWNTMLSMQNNGGIDLITLCEKLKKKGQLDDVGGIAYVAHLPDTVPSAANLSYYTGIVSEKFTLRQVIQTCTETVSRIYDEYFEVPVLLDSITTRMSEVINQSTAGPGQEYWDIGDLLAYDTANDPNAVIGFKDGKTTRYLCRGYGGWIIGQSGIGKSSVTHQMSYLFALGMPFCGIMPMRPLRVLIVQSENDIGDNAEAAQGIMDSIPGINPAKIKQIRENVRVVRCRGMTGAAFCRWLEREIKAWKADLCFVDPLLRFAGIDVSRQDQCTQFLNNCLDPVLMNTGVVLLGAHHTGKPKNARETKDQTIYDRAYAGIGSSELVNWARAIMIIQVIEGGVFELILSKRGPRAGACHLDNTPTTSIFMQHSHEKVYWEQIEPPELKQRTEGAKVGRKSIVDEVATSNLYEFCAGCKTEGEGMNVIAKRLENWLAKNKKDVSLKTCQRAIPALVANAKLTKGEDGLYRKGPEA